jgi:hypothetical protein
MDTYHRLTKHLWPRLTFRGQTIDWMGLPRHPAQRGWCREGSVCNISDMLHWCAILICISIANHWMIFYFIIFLFYPLSSLCKLLNRYDNKGFFWLTTYKYVCVCPNTRDRILKYFAFRGGGTSYKNVFIPREPRISWSVPGQGQSHVTRMDTRGVVGINLLSEWMDPHVPCLYYYEIAILFVGL